MRSGFRLKTVLFVLLVFTGGVLKMSSGQDMNLSLTVVYDNNRYDERLTPAWGFACILERDILHEGRQTFLFDTGGKGDLLLDNMRILGIKPETVDAVVLSHVSV